jgi:hypothetical protein
VKTIFALFENYKDARATVDELMKKKFDEEEMNAIVLEEIAKDSMEVNLETVSVEATEKVGEKTIQGLDYLIGVQQPVEIPGVGEVYAAGELAMVLSKTAAAPGAVTGGLKAALIDFGLPEKAAKAYTVGVTDGGLLFWIRTSDERAPEAISVLRDHESAHIASYGS